MDYRGFAYRFLNVLCALAGVAGTIILLLWLHYPDVKAANSAEEKAFWSSVDTLTAEDHSALLNFVGRTGRYPRMLPWWEMDNVMCSATAVKYVVLFTGVKLAHAKAWTVRTDWPKMTATGEDCTSCVNNARKLTEVWNHQDLIDENGKLAPGVKETLQGEVKAFPFEQSQVYLMGFLYEDTTFWEEVKAAGKDKNSHVGLWVRGKVIHFIHRESGVDPLYAESLDDLFSDGKLIPTWISRVHPKGNRDVLRMPETTKELPFCQNVMPYAYLEKALVFPRRFARLPEAWVEKGDSLLERSLFRWVRNGYDMYPRFVTSEAECKER